MGFNLKYVAAQAPIERLTADFGFALIGDGDADPYGEPKATRITDTNYSVLILKEPDINKSQLARVSKDYDILACSVAEFCMHSTAVLCSGGTEVWKIHHEGDGKDKTHLEVFGTPPPCFQDVKATALNKQMDQPGTKTTNATSAQVPTELKAIAEQMGGTIQKLSPETMTVDYVFDIAPNLVAELTGFRYDQFGASGEEKVWDVERLTKRRSQNAPPKPTFLSKLKGLFE